MRDKGTQGIVMAVWFWLLNVGAVVRLRNSVVFIKKRDRERERLALAIVVQLVGASSCKQKGCGFDSQSGHKPGLWVGPQLECIQESTDRCFSFISMFLSLR